MARCLLLCVAVIGASSRPTPACAADPKEVYSL